VWQAVRGFAFRCGELECARVVECVSVDPRVLFVEQNSRARAARGP
jgi:hypothetical protein